MNVDDVHRSALEDVNDWKSICSEFLKILNEPTKLPSQRNQSKRSRTAPNRRTMANWTESTESDLTDKLTLYRNARDLEERHLQL